MAGLRLHSVTGRTIDTSSLFRPADQAALDAALQSLRFFNCEMYYSDEELQILEGALKGNASSFLPLSLAAITLCRLWTR